MRKVLGSIALWVALSGSAFPQAELRYLGSGAVYKFDGECGEAPKTQ